ncbi:hypothetical protein COCOBI_02-0690 [Coccomyxa sp. Obi]|nr:hypothetical protein COCOBI_02-0690 [Coccomyxa sp. Obi]
MMNFKAAVLAAAVLCLAVGQAHAQAQAPLVSGQSGGWRQGRATWYGGPLSFLSNFKNRGSPPEYGFGDILYGSCGYFEQNFSRPVTLQDLPYPKEMYAALALTDPDYPGSCGRCYEVRCKSGLVLGNGTTPYRTDQGYSLSANAPNALDPSGRKWLGNPTADQGLQSVRCWNDSHSIFIVVADSCPCVVRGADGAVTGSNPPCCGNTYHMDLNFWGFDELSHPINGIMSTEFRPVDCITKQPLQFLPGFTNTTIYGERVEAGWAWFPFNQSFSNFWAPGQGLGGSNATCVQLSSVPGGLTFAMRSGDQPGYQPFKGASSLDFWIKNLNSSTTPPALRVSLGDYDTKEYCDNIALSSLTTTQNSGAYHKYSIPISSFNCGFPQSNISSVGFQNVKGQAASFCLDDIVISGGASSGGLSSGASSSDSNSNYGVVASGGRRM